MGSRKRVKAAPFTVWLLGGLAASVAAHALVFVGLAMVPWDIFGAGEPGPPTPLDLPWVSGVTGWTILIGTVGLTGIATWLDRGHQKRIDPLARIALCLSVLGFAEAISGAAMMAASDHWPVNRVGIAIWLLLAAIAVGALSWIRILRSRGELRGKVFATCAVCCSAWPAWQLHTYLHDHRYPPLPQDGIELPVAYHSREFFVWPDEPLYELRVTMGGIEEHEDLVEVARRMPKERYGDVDLPDAPLLIRADARASWHAVRGAFERVEATRIWKLRVATRWEEPATTTYMSFYLPMEVGVHVPEAPVPPSPVRLQVLADGSFTLEGRPIATADALAEELRHRYHDLRSESREAPVLRVEPDEQARWQDVMHAIDAARPRFEHFRLASFLVVIE